MDAETQAVDSIAQAIVSSMKGLKTNGDVTRYGVISRVNGTNYSVAVGGKSYSATADADKYKIGQRVAVTFIQNDPKHIRLSADKELSGIRDAMEAKSSQSIEDKISPINSQLSALSTRMSTAETQITQINAALSNLEAWAKKAGRDIGIAYPLDEE